jgi:hypothetical protein
LISFRNHVVTLVAVFLALAVGVVLGGGPLSEVGRTPLASATPAQEETADVATFGDTFAEAGAGRLYAGGLDGHPVTLLTLPGSDEKMVTGITDQVQQAGGTVAATYAGEESLVDVGEKSLVDTLGSQLMTQLGSDVAEEGAATYVRMGQLLGGAIATTALQGAASDENSSAIRQALAGAELAAGPDGNPKRSPLVLVVLGDDVDDDVLAGLLSGLAAKAAGVVAVGDTAAADSTHSGDLAGLRTSPLASDVATVDGAEHGLGQVSTVLALIRSLSTKGGAFGASGSDGAVPLG